MKLINMRNRGAMMSDPTIREGFVQGSVARVSRLRAPTSPAQWQAFGRRHRYAGRRRFGEASRSNQAQMEKSKERICGFAPNAKQKTRASSARTAAKRARTEAAGFAHAALRTAATSALTAASRDRLTTSNAQTAAMR